MSVVKVTITSEWQLIAAKRSTFTVSTRGGGVLLFSTGLPDDETAVPLHKNESDRQVIQYSSDTTYIRHTGEIGEDWTLTFDDNPDIVLNFIKEDGVLVEVAGQNIIEV